MNTRKIIPATAGFFVISYGDMESDKDPTAFEPELMPVIAWRIVEAALKALWAEPICPDALPSGPSGDCWAVLTPEGRVIDPNNYGNFASLEAYRKHCQLQWKWARMSTSEREHHNQAAEIAADQWYRQQQEHEHANSKETV
jgi:hypothetical protein